MKKIKEDTIKVKDTIGDAFIKFMESQGFNFVDVTVKDEAGKLIKIKTLKDYIPKRRY